MSYKIHYSGNAEKDADETSEHYEKIDTSLCLRFLMDIDNTITDLKRNPEAFHYYKRNRFIRRANLSIFPYSVYFSIPSDSSTVVVLAIIHNSRSKSFINKKLK
jgi:mRNA-degrading endonuclease RelE of RelBE toxin-antitoxin system